ncbi:probable disease resistance protein At4g19520 [Raphanus sativus]|uniref:Probable disease resistance protein At4g19520 n=1 Tax=Raphanus sativus TaxID=3726 RepID=A0A6J0N8P5_RAPSA|nr:probable disease resistance protein At4g19520 [Raphanus sativus]XP_056863754.1 probable disease resistance protein At4g19520 [Raphanus sativus]
MVDGNAVCISFNRWEDTIRHSFISHLSAEFRRKSIYVSTCQNSDEAIAEAKVSVVILSEKSVSNYRFLNELVKVSACRSSHGLLVVPVFYGLTKSVLRKYCLLLKKMYPEDPVADWRNALLEIADLRGYASSLERSDSELVEEIVADVRQKLDLEGTIGVYSRLTKIQNLIHKQPLGIRSLGLWGMGGIGKTTLAKAALKQYSGDFEASCFIEDFDKDFQEKGVYGLLEKHLREKVGLSSHVTRLSLLIDTLRQKKILLVLDDVRKPLGATTFLSEFDWLGPGSLVIITSRDKQALVQCQVNDIYEVQGLKKHEALQLLSRCAFGKDVPADEKLMELSMNLVDYAEGNPLALSVFGEELKGKKTLSEMESVVRKHKRPPLPDKIFNTLKISYDSLGDTEKEIFLEIVFSFRGVNIDDAMQFLEGCGYFPRVGIDVLMDKSLVTVSDNRVQMHNLIYDLGLQIIKDPTEETETAYRFVDASNIQSLLEENEVRDHEAAPTMCIEDIKGISLDVSNLDLEGHNIAFKEMYNLRSLKVHSSNAVESPILCLSEEPQSLPPELRLLYWTYCPLKSLPQNFDVQYLVELNMPCSQFRKLWGGTKNLEVLKRITLSNSLQLVNVDELQHSRNIELIDLQGCSSLKSFPDMGQSQHLLVVNLSNCIEIKCFPKVPPSINKLHLQGTGVRELSTLDSFSSQDLGNLVFLNVKNCSNLRTLPDMITFESLQVLNLSGCSELEKIQGLPQNEIPSSSLCSKLVTLDMENCKRLIHLPMGMCNMESLAKLKLSGCSNLENIQDLPRNLKELYLAGTAVKAFPSPSLENLSNLVILSLEDCKKLRHLQVGMSKLESLVTLKLSGCSELKTIADLPQNLKELYLGGTAIRELPSSIGDLAELDTLVLKSCKRLRRLPVEMLNLNPLKVLDLLNCTELEVVTTTLPKVRELRQAHKLTPLRSKLPSSVSRFYQQIVTLSLHKARLEHIPEDICLMSLLKALDLSGNCFRNIPESIKEFTKLLSLRLCHCKNLRVLPELPQSLQLLNAHGCSSLISIPLDFFQSSSYYTFSNCFHLSPYMVSYVLAEAQATVEEQHMVGPQRQQKLEKVLAVRLCLPCRDSKYRLHPYLQPGSSVMLRLNHYSRSMLVGFALFVEVSFSKDFHNAAGLGFRCVCRWNDKKGRGHRLENVFKCLPPGEAVPKITKDHMFVFFDLKMHPSTFILADLVVFDLYPVNNEEKPIVGNSVKVKKCGVYVFDGASGSSSRSTSTRRPSSLDRFRLSEDEVKRRLRVSYDGLQKREKDVFLYIGCFLSDDKVEMPLPFLANIDFGSTLEVLASKSLIDISSKGEIRMQLLQRKLCREIVRRKFMMHASKKELVSELLGNREYRHFLSFNKEDAKKSFISYFIYKLKINRLRALHDDQILKRLLTGKAIKESIIEGTGLGEAIVDRSRRRKVEQRSRLMK